MKSLNLKKILKKIFKVFLWIVGSVLGLFLLLVIALQIPAVQNFAKNKAVSYLEGKINTKVSIDRIEIGLPKKIILEGVYFEDQQKDTLLAGEKLAVDISLLKLMRNTVEINAIDLKGITANISKNNDSVFNFDYIVKAFASPKKPKDDAAPMQFSIDKINLDNIKVRYADAIAKNDISLRLNHFDTRIKTFDLDKLAFEIPKITISGLRLKLEQGLLENVEEVAEIVQDNATEKELKLTLGTIDLSKINIDYQNETSKIATAIALEKLLVSFKNLDIKNQLIAISNLELSDTKGTLAIGKLQKLVSKKAATTTPPANNWKIKIDNTDVQNFNFKFDDANAITLQKGIDYKHLDFKDFNLSAENIDYNSKIIAGSLKSLSVQEKSGLNIQSFKTDFYYDDKGASLKNLLLKTPQTLIRDEIIVGYPSLKNINENLGEIAITAKLKNSQLGFKDVLLFAPKLQNTNPFSSNPNAKLLINTSISGKLNNIAIPNFEVSGIGSTKIAASGKIIGLPDVKKAYFDLKIKNLQTSAIDINAFVPKGTIPNNILLPNQLTTAGNFRGTINNFSTNLNLFSTLGDAKIIARFDQRQKNNEKYNANVAFDNFDLGRFIKNNAIGKISLKASVQGIGLNPKTANAKIDGTILKADYNNYVYNNLKLKGKINKGLYDVNANTNDPNLTFNLASNGSFRGKYPAVKMKLIVDIADLEKLNLHAGPMKLRGDVDADIATLDLDFLNGTISANNIIIANAKEQYVLDSINVVAISTSEKNSLLLKSQFLNAALDGKYKLSTLANNLQNSISHYYNTNSKKSTAKLQQQQLAFKIDVKDSPIISKLVPSIKSISPISFSGRYNSKNDSIILNGTIPKLIYAENTILGAILKVDTKDNALVYSLVVDDVENQSFQLPYTSISGTVKNNVVDYALQLKDLKNADKYLLSGTLKAVNGNSEISLNPANLLLNYETWNLTEDNLLRFGKNGIYANNFELSKSGNAIKLQSESAQPNAPLAITFIDFEIETLTKIAQKSDLQIGGKINGSALIKNLKTTPVFTSNLAIANFSFQKDTVGDLNIKVDNNIANTFNAQIAITGQDNQVNLDGIYKTSNSTFDFDLLIQKLNMKSIQGFTFGNLTESTGFLSGDFKITGSAKKPSVLGELKFNEIGFKAKQLNATFKSINDKIVFTQNAIVFDKFTIKDEKDNDLIVDGTINSQDFSNLGFDLNVIAKNFKAVNSKAKDNDVYYGELFLDNNLQIKGTVNNPVVEGTIKINKDTKFTVVLPQSDPSIADREGIVEFIDQDQPKLNKTLAIDEAISTTEVKGVSASVNIEIDKEAEMSIIIDKTNGDFVKLQGEADLTGGIDRSGKTTLTGRYEFTEGSYEMSFNLIKRKFDIKPGSYILWTGEPTMANVNLTAIYKSETAPIDLVDDQLVNVSANVRNTYKERIPFETQLKMNGELLKPVITFDIILPDGNNDVSTEIINTTQAKLAQLREQPDELNKQVFALLLLNRFIGENPFASESGGTSAAGLARQSASKILSQQLNNLAGDLIKGVSLDFDLDSSEDFSSGQRENKTDLNVGLSKTLLNDRLKVSIGSSFGLEGTAQENENANTIAGDISADYQLSKDGRYKVRAYRKNKYQVALQGQVVETGVAFIITIDYNKFKELLQKNKDAKAKKNANK